MKRLFYAHFTMPQDAGNLIWIDLEMTGLDPETCAIVQLAMILTDTELKELAPPLELTIWQPESVLGTMSPFVRAMHEKSGLLSQVRASEISASTRAWYAEHTPAAIIWDIDDRGRPIDGLKDAESLANVAVFHAGTKATPAGVVTWGGRVLGVTASSSDLRAAIERAYAAVAKIRFEGMQYRHDIGQKGLKRWPTIQ